MEKKALLRAIPKVDDLLRDPALSALDLSPAMLRDAVREELDTLRKQILSGAVTEIPELSALCGNIVRRAQAEALPSLRPAINATGVTLHTNLGRACLSEQAVKAVTDVVRGYSTLEYDVEHGCRGSRHSHVEDLLVRLTGAEAAMVVNNNAAAVLLILSEVGAGGEVVASRGELVEVGGSFRIPDIMTQCGCSLREVGATNKTHLRDYERAIGENTRALLKVHTSNYRIIGFSESVPLADLTALAHSRGLPMIEDLGSGALLDLSKVGIHGEPTVQQSVQAGVDLISFSGDKLLGGPQAGLIVGTKDWIDRLKQHSLARAMRVDKMTLAALSATLRSYLDESEALRDIPTLAMLGTSVEELEARAEKLCGIFKEQGLSAQVVPTEDQVGGGSAPLQLLSSRAVALDSGALTVDALEEKMRRRKLPIIGRISQDRYLLDVRTLKEADFPLIAEAAREILA